MIGGALAGLAPGGLHSWGKGQSKTTGSGSVGALAAADGPAAQSEFFGQRALYPCRE